MRLRVDVKHGIIRALCGYIGINSDKFSLASGEYSIDDADLIYITIGFPLFFMTKKKRLVLKSASDHDSVNIRISLKSLPEVVFRTVLLVTVSLILFRKDTFSPILVSIGVAVLLYAILDGISKNVIIDIDERDRSNFVDENISLLKR